MNTTMIYRNTTTMSTGKARQPSAREVSASAMVDLGISRRMQPQAYLLRDAANFGMVARILSQRSQQRVQRFRSAVTAALRTVWRWL
jgi:hypothetical protein